MAQNYTLKYRTFSEMLADVRDDFQKYELKDLISDQQLIKIAKKVNYDLGLRIHETKEVVLEIEKGRTRLPADFYVFNFAMAVGSYTVKSFYPQGTHVEDRVIASGVVPVYKSPPSADIDWCETVLEDEPCDPCDPCSQCGQTTNCQPCVSCCANPDSCSLTCKGDVIQLVQVIKSEVRQYDWVQRLRLVGNSEQIMPNCPNRYWDAPNTVEIRDGFIWTSFQTGRVYLNYQGQLEDLKGNLLVPDHPLLNEYYEYAAKDRILENLIMNGENITQIQIQLIKTGLRNAKIAALTFVNTPNYSELQEVWLANRNAMYSKYYDMFSSSPRK